MTWQNLLEIPSTAATAPLPQPEGNGGAHAHTLTIQQAIQLARRLLQAGELQMAGYALRQILDAQPGQADARGMLEDVHSILGYQERIEQMSKSTALDYPKQVHIETIGLCNAKCVFCVYPQMERIGTKMEDSLFRKVIGDLKEIPAHHPFSVVPYKINDPFLDKGIFDKMRLINAELPHAGIILSTNGISLREEHIEQLNEIRNITFFWISLNAHDRETYKQRMGVNTFDKVVRNIHMTLKTFNRPELLRIGRVRTGTPEDDLFYQFVGREFGGGSRLAGNTQGNFLGHVETLLPVVPQISCAHWFEISITCTGKVSFCCMDGHCEHPLGDVRTENVLSIYNRAPLRGLRERMQQRKSVDPCRSCNYP